jgi:phenylacetate-CoA ligase
LALEGGILSRTDDMLVVRGVNIHPSAVEEVIRSCDGVAEYQVHLDSRHALTELSVKIETTPDAGDPLKLVDKLEQAFQSAFSLRVPVRAMAPGTLPRSEMKAKRWIRL